MVKTLLVTRCLNDTDLAEEAAMPGQGRKGDALTPAPILVLQRGNSGASIALLKVLSA
jgi:hypothetical protein